MKKYIISVYLLLIASIAFPQGSTPLSLGEGSGVRLYSLQQLKDSALRSNMAVRKAHYAIESAQEQRKEAFTKYFPNISGTALTFNANRGMAKMDLNPSEMMSPQIGASLAQMLPPELLAELSAPMSMSMMKKGTVAGITAVQPVFALDAVDSMLLSIRKDVDVAVKAGVAMHNDQLQVQLRQNDIESQRVKLQNGISIVKMLLAQYCGLGTTTDGQGFDVVMPEADILSSVNPMPVGATSTLDLLPEYQLLQKQVEATDLQRRITTGKNLPSVAVGVGYNYHNLLENDRTFAMVFATVSVPISDWWGGSHAIKRSKIDQQRAKDELADNSELLRIRMQKSWNDVGEAYQQLLIAQRSIGQAEENLRLNRNYYQAGTSTMSDLLQAQLLYQQALDKRTDAFADYQNKLLEYRQSTGTNR